jgi:hypothetical protein
MTTSIRSALTYAAVAVVGIGATFAFGKVTAVTFDDVATHFDLGSAEARVGISGGDIFAVARTGRSTEKICTFELREQYVRREKVEAYFTNALGARLPFLARWLGNDLGDAAIKGEELEGARLRFAGEFTELQTDAPRRASDGCERRMIEYANDGYRICMVRSSLIPTDRKVFSAYRFDPLQVFLPDAVFEKHGQERSDKSASVRHLPCPQSSEVPWDVAIRKSLRVIRMDPA